MKLHLIAAALASVAPLALTPATAHVAASAAVAGTPVPKEQLLKPPADAVHYVVVSEAGKHGDQKAAHGRSGNRSRERRQHDPRRAAGRAA